MEPIGLISGLLAVAKDALALVVGARSAKREDNDRAAVYFAHLGETLAAIEAELRLGRTPHAKCGELQQHAEHLVDRTGNVIGTAEAVRLSTVLMANYNSKSTLISLADTDEKELHFAKMAEASGKFTAMAHILRA